MTIIVIFLILSSINIYSSELVVIDTEYKPIKDAEIVINEKTIGNTNSMGILDLEIEPNTRIQINHTDYNSKNFVLERSQSKIVVKLAKMKEFERADLEQYESFNSVLEFFELKGNETSSFTIPIKDDEKMDILIKDNEEYFWDSIVVKTSEYAASDKATLKRSVISDIDELSKRPTNSIREIEVMTKGVKAEGSGFTVRNSRTDATVIKVDGVEVSETGGYSAAIDYSVSSSGFSNNNAGQLTAGIINDFAKWELWEDIDQTELVLNKKIWEFDPKTRYSVIVSNSTDYPVIGAKVKLMKEGRIKWETLTDNLGRAELWSEIFEEDDYQNYQIEIEYKDQKEVIENPSEFKDGVNNINLDVACDEPNQVDIAFVVDATGSMGDEINYLKVELGDIIAKTKIQLPEIDLNLASVFYRDESDEYLGRYIDMTSRIETNLDFISLQEAGGGGDYPEAVSTALDIALNKISWRENTINKLLFLVLDAPPHNEKKDQIQELTKLAASKGIRIIPVACSGTDKSTEYLTRSIALATGGRYIFLTDDSGIGGAHIKPTTDEYEVLSLNEAILTTILDYSKTNSCKLEAEKQEDDITYNPDFIDNFYVNGNESDIEPDFTQWKIYPNPTRGRFVIEADGTLGRIFIADMRGGIIKEIDATGETEIFISLNGLPSGQYLVMQELESGKFISSRIILTK